MRLTAHSTDRTRIVLSLRSYLHGLSQIFFLANGWTGALLLLALFWEGPLYGAAALVGTVSATATAALIGVKGEEVRAGLYGFNGTLVAIALPHLLGRPGYGGALWALIIVGAVLSTVLQVGFAKLLVPYGIPVSTGPFVLTAWLLLLALRAPAAPPPALFGAPWRAALPWLGLRSLLGAICRGVGQVMLMQRTLSGALVLLGIFVGSWQGGVMAVIGSAVGVLLPVLLGARWTAVGLGLFAFNPTLAAMALGAIFTRFSGRSILAGTGAAVLSLALTPVIALLAWRLRLPGLTAPYLVTLYVLMALRRPASVHPEGGDRGEPDPT